MQIVWLPLYWYVFFPYQISHIFIHFYHSHVSSTFISICPWLLATILDTLQFRQTSAKFCSEAIFNNKLQVLIQIQRHFLKNITQYETIKDSNFHLAKDSHAPNTSGSRCRAQGEGSLSQRTWTNTREKVARAARICTLPHFKRRTNVNLENLSHELTKNNSRFANDSKGRGLEQCNSVPIL